MGAPLGAEGPAAFGFAAALAVRDACIASGAAPERLTLKWPNDVLLDGGKLSGLLIELLDNGAGRGLAIGIGVNLAEAPRGLPYEAACLADAVPDIVTPAPAPGPITERSGDEPRGKLRVTSGAAATFLRRLDAAFRARMGDWQTRGFSALRDAWLSAAQGLGEPVTVRLPNETLEGVFEDLSANGALQLRTSQGLREITAGDVFFPDRSG